MRLIRDWQYKYIEKCLFNYYKLANSSLDTELKMYAAINAAHNYFQGTIHATMMEEYYFKADKYRKTYTNAGHYQHVCLDIVHTEEPNGYVLRREIIYRIAMYCYELHVFKSNLTGGT